MLKFWTFKDWEHLVSVDDGIFVYRIEHNNSSLVWINSLGYTELWQNWSVKTIIWFSIKRILFNRHKKHKWHKLINTLILVKILEKNWFTGLWSNRNSNCSCNWYWKNTCNFNSCIWCFKRFFHWTCFKIKYKARNCWKLSSPIFISCKYCSWSCFSRCSKRRCTKCFAK